MTKTIIFDLGGVYFTDGTKQAIKTISEKYKLNPKKIKEVLNGELGTEYRIGKITANVFWGKAKKYWNITAPSDILTKIWLSGYKPINGTVEIIKRLKNAGHELLFLSDNVKERVEYLSQKYDFLSDFKDGIFSHKAKVKKPNPKIYLLALEKSSHSAKDCIYIDDKPELLEPAAKLGMKVIQFKNPKQLERDLETLKNN